MTAEEFLNKKYNGKGYSAKVHDWNKSTHHNIVLPDLLEEFTSLKTKELKEESLPIKFIQWYSGMKKYQIISAYERWKKETNQH